MESITDRAHAAGDQTNECAGAREIRGRHLPYGPSNYGKRHDGNERDRYDAFKSLITENRLFPVGSGS